MELMKIQPGRSSLRRRWSIGATCAMVLCFTASSTALGGPTYRLTNLTPWANCGGSAGCAEAWAINAAGQVTGTVQQSSGTGYAAFRGDRYSSEELDTLGGPFSLGWDINSDGDITGYSYPAGGFQERAVIWTGGEIQDLDTLGGTFSYGVAINDLRHVAGVVRLAGGGTRGFFWDGTQMHAIPTLGGESSFANAMNEAGMVVGGSSTADGYFFRAYRWHAGALVDLGTLADGLGESYAFAINAAGHVVGSSMTLPDGDMHAYFWDGTAMRDLGTLGGRESEARLVNDAGNVAGNSAYLPGQYLSGRLHAFFWDGATMRDLGTLGGIFSQANDMNEAGHVVGNSETSTGEDRPFLWDGQAMHDLNDLIDPADPLKPFVTLFRAWRINDRGDIAAEGRDSRYSDVHVFLLSVTRPDEVFVTGLAPPVDALPTLNAAKSGQTIPLKFHVALASGAPITDLKQVTVTSQAINCASLNAATIDPVEQYAAGNTVLLNLGHGDYQFNWKTIKGVSGCQVMTLKLPPEYDATPDGLSANFSFK